jgi:hypothetical protein
LHKYDTTTKLLAKIRAKYKQLCTPGNVIHGKALLPLTALPDSKLKCVNNIGTPKNYKKRYSGILLNITVKYTATLPHTY